MGGGVFGLGNPGGRGGHSDPGNLGGRGGQKTWPSARGGVDFFWNNPMIRNVRTSFGQSLDKICIHACTGKYM